MKGPMEQRDEFIARLKKMPTDEQTLLADGFEKAFVGIGRQCNKSIAVYDYERCIELLVADGLTFDEAFEHFNFNVAGAYVGEYTPIFLLYLPSSDTVENDEQV